MDNKRLLEKFDENFEARAAFGIETFRKGNFKVKVTDKDGNAMVGKRVRVKLKQHEFRFGANCFMLDEMESEYKNETYKQKFAELFNMATLPFYWDATEPTQGVTRYHKGASKLYRRPSIDLCMEYCAQHGIEPREHALCYDMFFPEWVRHKPDSFVKAALENRMKEISSKYGDKINTIEVTNELYYDGKNVSDFYNSRDFVEWCYKTAEKYFPANQIGINTEQENVWNQVSHNNRYYLQIENALLKGLRIDAVGMQFHMFFRMEQYFEKTRKYYDPDRMYALLDLFAEFNRPLQLTEMTIPAFTDNPEDEEHQADALEKVYKMLFSHPAVEQIIYWNLVDGYAAFTTAGNMTQGENYYRGGLLRFDMSEKPAFKRLKKLFTEDWSTDVTLTTDEAGCVSLRAFYGDYEVTADGVSAKAELKKNSAVEQCVKL